MKKIILLLILIVGIGSLMGDVISYTSYSTPDNFPTNLYGIANYEMTDIDRDIYVKKFDTNLGTLSAATLSITYHLNTTLTATNDNDVEQEIDASSDSRATWTNLPINVFEPDGIYQNTLSNYPNNPGDQTYTANQTKVWGPVNLSNTYGIPFLSYTGLDLAQFEHNGNGNIIVDLVTLSSYTVYGASNSTVSQDSDCYGEITVTYTYEPRELPVTLSSFTAMYLTEGAHLQWTTQSESANMGWNIYRSTTGNADEASQLNVSLIDGAGTVSEPTDYMFVDGDYLATGQTYYYWIEDVTYGNVTTLHGPVSVQVTEEGVTPETPEIAQQAQINNYPNPFNPDTNLFYSLKDNEVAESIEIYNVRGQKVRSFDAPTNPQQWNGKDMTGAGVSSGIYMYVLKTNQNNYVKKMVLSK